jgi:hypothetical protein
MPSKRALFTCKMAPFQRDNCGQAVVLSGQLWTCGGLQNGRRPAHFFFGAAQPCKLQLLADYSLGRMSVSGPLVELPFHQQLPSSRSSSTDIDVPGRESVKEGKSSSMRRTGRCSKVEMPISSTETTLARHNLTCLDDVCSYHPESECNYPT